MPNKNHVNLNDVVTVRRCFNLLHDTLTVDAPKMINPIGLVNDFLIAKQLHKIEKQNAQNAVIGKSIRCGYSMHRSEFVS